MHTYNFEHTFAPYRMMEWSTVTDVSDEATAPTRIPMITRPVRVQMIAKIRAGIDRGDRSPYLLTEKKKST